MAIINCPECNKEISNSANKCPNCGYKISKKKGCFTYIIALVVVIVVIYIISLIGGSEGSSVIDDKKTYSLSWREPVGSEELDISRIMIKNNIKGCGAYYVKEVTNSEFVVACTSDGKSYTYYVVYTKINKIYLANDEMIRKLEPPKFEF